MDLPVVFHAPKESFLLKKDKFAKNARPDGFNLKNSEHPFIVLNVQVGGISKILEVLLASTSNGSKQVIVSLLPNILTTRQKMKMTGLALIVLVAVLAVEKVRNQKESFLCLDLQPVQVAIEMISLTTVCSVQHVWVAAIQL